MPKQIGEASRYLTYSSYCTRSATEHPLPSLDLKWGWSRRVFLTQNGVAARRQARDLVVSVNDRLREHMGSDSVDRLLTEMKRLNEILDEPSSLMAGLDSGSLSATSTYE